MTEGRNLYGPRQFACADCKEMFDPETRPPFTGSCDHSLCSVCVNEKQITTCPICNEEEAFASKQENKLAAGLLASLMKTEEYRFPPILEPHYQPFFARIANNLDPRSFANLSRTCKTMHTLCFKTTEVKINYEIPWIMVSTDSDPLHFQMNVLHHVDFTGNSLGFMGSVENRKKLANFPFVFKMKGFFIHGSVDANALTRIRSYFAEFPISSVSSVHLEKVDDWRQFIQFVEDFHVTDVEVNGRNSPAAQPIPDEFASYFLQNMANFRCDWPIPERLVLDAPVKTAWLTTTKISEETFKQLLQRFANSTEEIKWRLSRENFDFGHFDLFKTINDDELYYEEFTEERPLTIKYDDEDFKIKRKDEKYLHVYCDEDAVVLCTVLDPDAEPVHEGADLEEPDLEEPDLEHAVDLLLNEFLRNFYD